MKINAFHEYPMENKEFPLSCSFTKGDFFFPMHYHQEVEMIYVEKGSIIIHVLQKSYEVKEGQLVIIGCNHIHSYVHKEKSLNNQFHLLIFDWKFLKRIIGTVKAEQQVYPILFDVNIIDTKYNEGLKPLRHLFQQLSLEGMNKEGGSDFVLLGCLYELVGLLIRYGEFDSSYKPNMKQIEKEHQLLSKVNAYIFKNYQSGITLSGSAKDLGYSEFHFARQFKRYTGITFKQYLTHYQVSMAREDIVNDTLTITAVAFKHGFNSVKTFNRVFKNYFGLAPTVYRKKVNHSDEPAN